WPPALRRGAHRPAPARGSPRSRPRRRASPPPARAQPRAPAPGSPRARARPAPAPRRPTPRAARPATTPRRRAHAARLRRLRPPSRRTTTRFRAPAWLLERGEDGAYFAGELALRRELEIRLVRGLGFGVVAERLLHGADHQVRLGPIGIGS